VTGPTPLLDFFRRGDVARDVRLLAAQGALAPRAYEQLAILLLLTQDSDPEVRQTAERTIAEIPIAALRGFLGRSGIPDAMQAFFAARGIAPDPSAQADDAAELPLVDNSPPTTDSDELARKSAVQLVAEMSFTERLKAALKGGREVRAILIRDANKTVAATVLSNPRVSDQEVEIFARMPHVAEETLRIIAATRGWVKNYGVVLALVKNPKTPIAISLHLMPRLGDRDLAMLSIDRNVPDVLRVTARRKVVDGASR
jgi:hypothetical protein